uniref:N-acetyltransferase domain-containing protein n=1 Tax=Graphocephala atropunctata TaxID=36148 RepID=A0A1B6L6K2_9HEMI
MAECINSQEPMVDFMDFVEENGQLHEISGKTIELFVLSVSSEWRQRGIAKRLVEESMRLARDAGFETMTIFCTGEFVARIPRSLGWREYYRLAYKDYPMLSGKDVHLIPIPPHDHVYYFVINL